MTNYTNFGVTLSQYQMRKIKSAYKKGISIIIRISKNNLSGKILLAKRIAKKNLSGNMNIPLTDPQINKIKKAKSGVQLHISKSQLSHLEKHGGFLPLLALLPAVLGALGGVAGIAGGVSSAVNSSKQTSEMTRHNKAIEDLAKQQLGSGIISDAVSSIPLVGKKLSVELKKIGLGNCCVKNLKGVACGGGLYLEREGNGLFLARQGE